MVQRSSNRDELLKHIPEKMELLETLEQYWAFPGISRLSNLKQCFERKEYGAFSNSVSEIVRELVSRTYRTKKARVQEENGTRNEAPPTEEENINHYFEVVVVDDIADDDVRRLRTNLAEISDNSDDFQYDTLVVKTFQDALIALQFNFNIQAVVIRYGIPYKSSNNLSQLKPFVGNVLKIKPNDYTESEIGTSLAQIMKTFRPELDLYLVTDMSLNEISQDVYRLFGRIFYRQEDLQELHLSIIKGIQERYNTPFFTALMKYSQQPTGVFHAMPVSRGNSIFKSHWIRDMGEFYGRNIFLAETSATTGGLDSLLQPTGPLKTSQELAARAFGSRQTFLSPTALQRPTKLCYKHWSSLMMSSLLTAIATNRTTMVWCCKAPIPFIWTAFR